MKKTKLQQSGGLFRRGGMRAVAASTMIAVLFASQMGLAETGYNASTYDGAQSGVADAQTSVNSMTGAASVSESFELPPARGEAQPELGLTYSSNAGDAEAGYGWSLNMPSIVRRRNPDGFLQMPASADVSFSFPQDTLPTPTPAVNTGYPAGGTLPGQMKDWYEWNGRPLELICENVQNGCENMTFSPDVTGQDYYGLRNEDGSFTRFFHMPGTGAWTVQYKSGVTENYGGGYGFVAETTLPGQPVVRSFLSSRRDANGNGVHYIWNRVGIRGDGEVLSIKRGLPYLTDIYYNAKTADTLADAYFNGQLTSSYEYHVALVWEANDFPQQHYAPVWAARPELRLKRVDVAAKNWEGQSRTQVRRYRLSYLAQDTAAYDPAVHVPLKGHSFLKSIQLEGASSAEESMGSVAETLPTAASGPLRRPTVFTYAPRQTTMFTSFATSAFRARVPQTEGPWGAILDDMGRVAVADINRDGWPDILQDYRKVLRNTASNGSGNPEFSEDCGTEPLFGGSVPVEWDPFLRQGRGLTSVFPWGSQQRLSFFYRNAELVDSTKQRNVAGYVWRMVNASPSNTACYSSGASYTPQTWKFTIDAGQDTRLRPYGPAAGVEDRVEVIGDIDGDGIPDAYVPSMGNVLATTTQNSRGVIRFSRLIRDLSQQHMARFAERVPTNLRFEGYSCSSPGNPASCQFDDYTGVGTTFADAKYADRLKAFVDMNGDGVADAVGSSWFRNVKDGTYQPQYRLGYYAGNGRGQFNCAPAQHQQVAGGPALPVCSEVLGSNFGIAGGGGAMPITLSNRSPYDTNRPSNRPLFHDLNNDGYTDVIIPRVRLDEYHHSFRMYFAIFLNEGGFGFRRYCASDPTGATCVGENTDDSSPLPEVSTDPFITPSPWESTSPRGDGTDGVFTDYRIDFADTNADGTDEILVLQQRAVDVLAFRGPLSTKPGLLTKVATGNGSTTTLSYDTYQHTIRNGADGDATNLLPVVTTVVTSMHSDNGLTGNANDQRGTSYEYRRPAFDPWTRSLVGFGQVTASHSSEPDVRTTYVYTPCHSGNGCVATSAFDLASSADGQVVSVEHGKFLDGTPGSIFRQETFGYEARPLTSQQSPRVFTRTAWKKTRIFGVESTNSKTTSSQSVITFTQANNQIPVDALVPVWSGDETTTLYEDYKHDAFGNVTKVRDWGRVEDDLTPIDDSKLTTTTSYDRFGPAWGWRPLESTAWNECSLASCGSVGFPSSAHRRTLFTYDTLGNLIATEADLQGSLSLDRFHEPVPGQVRPVAPTLPTASTDGRVTLRTYKRNSRGQVILEAGPFVPGASGLEGPCVEYAYDAGYSHFPTQATSAKKMTLGATTCVGALAGGAAATSEFVYNRGFGQVIASVSPQLAVSLNVYDAFGRLTAAYDPDPNAALVSSATPRVQVDYLDEPTFTGTHVVSMDGAETYSYADSFGQPVLSLSRTQTGAAAGWVASTAEHSGGNTVREDLPFPYSGSPTAPAFGLRGPAWKGYAYDIQGRIVAVYDGPNQIGRSVYRSASTLTYDAEGLKTSGANAGNHSIVYYDGHGRVTQTTKVKSNDTYTVSYSFDDVAGITGETHYNFGAGSYQRIYQLDNFGRMVSQYEPNTRKNGHTWRYAYDNAGRLVGTSDARGCGENLHYDAIGRLVAADYSPCLATHAVYSEPNLTTGDGTEEFVRYDVDANADPSNVPGAALGRVVARQDRGAFTRMGYDLRGRATGTSRRIVKPGAPEDTLANRYSDHWFARGVAYDGLDRPTQTTTGADVPELLVGGVSAATMTYGVRGNVASVGSSYGALVQSVTLRPDGHTTQVQLGDAGATQVTYAYGPYASARVSNVKMTRTTTPALWGSANDVPAPSGEPTRQQYMFDTSYTYDLVGNPTAITDNLASRTTDWPTHARPTSLTATYDEDYRLSSVTYSRTNHTRRSPQFTEGAASRALPRMAVTNRVRGQTFSYSWRGNIVDSRATDPGAAQYDQYNGEATFGTPSDGPDQLVNTYIGTTETVHLSYDDAGNTVDMFLRRPGTCDSSKPCNQRFAYDWDEIGQLSRARRWDYATVSGSTPVYPTPPGGTPAYDLSYAYSATSRVLKTSTSGASAPAYTLEVFPSLRVERTSFTSNDYARTASNENVYVGGLGHVIYGGTGLPAAGLGRVRLFLELKDMLGSTSVVLDHRTAEVVEKVSYDVNGSTDADYRPARWAGFREDYRFTGKEEDIEVGLTYFGARYLNTNLRRWISPDPLTIHGGAGDSDPYAYVAGRVLAAVDLFGLDITDVQPHANGEYSWVDSNTEERLQFGSAEALAAARARSAPAAAAQAAAPAVKQAPRTGTKPPQTAPAPPAGLDPNVPTGQGNRAGVQVAAPNGAGSGQNYYGQSGGDAGKRASNVEVIVWAPVGHGGSSFGHASVRVGNRSYSFGPNGVDRKSFADYVAKQPRDGVGFVLALTPEQERQFEAAASGDRPKYNILWNNCTDLPESGLRAAGVGLVVNPVMPTALGRLLLASGLVAATVRHEGNPSLKAEAGPPSFFTLPQRNVFDTSFRLLRGGP